MSYSLKRRAPDASRPSAAPIHPSQSSPPLVSECEPSSIGPVAQDQRLPTALLSAKRAYDLGGRYFDELGPAVCGDPGWNILLDLFISAGNFRRLSVSAVCIGSRAASATALRYISLLHDAGLVERIADTTDGRRSYVVLTEAGFRKMMDLLEPGKPIA